MNIITITQLNASTPRPVTVHYKGLEFIVSDSIRWSTYRVTNMDGNDAQEYNSIADVKDWVRLVHAASIEEADTATEFGQMQKHAESMGAILCLTSMGQNGHDTVVLAVWRGEYVTWKFFNGAFHHGWYCQKDTVQARADFYKRAQS